jgi:hypothetical protein
MSLWRSGATKLLWKYGAVRDFSTRDFGREPHGECVSVVIPGGGTAVQEQAVTVLRAVRAQLPPGTVAWLGTTRWLGEERYRDGVELVVGPGASPADMLRHAASDAVNYDLTTEDLVARLMQWHAAYGVDVFHAETDTIELEFLRAPTDLAAFAAEVYAFCPDIVDQGVGTVEALVAELRDSLRLYLWWD